MSAKPTGAWAIPIPDYVYIILNKNKKVNNLTKKYDNNNIWR